MKKALLVIDAQEDFIGDQRNTSKFDYYDVDETVLNINEKVRKFKNDGDYVIYITTVMANNFLSKKLFGYGISGTAGAKIAEKIDIVSENYYEKNKPDAFVNKNFREFIKKHEITKLYFSGADVNGSISKTAKSAAKFGFKATVLNDCIAKDDEESFGKISSKLRNDGVAFI